MKKTHLKNFRIFQEMEKNSCTLGLLVILLAEQELFKQHEIIFLSLPAAVSAIQNRSKFRLYEQFPQKFIKYLGTTNKTKSL